MSQTSIGLQSKILRKFDLVKSYCQVKNNSTYKNGEFIDFMLDYIIEHEKIILPKNIS